MSQLSSVRSAYWLLLAATFLAAAVYWPGLSGSWLFDDYPNIVDNAGVQPHQASLPALVSATLSSPASDFKRPLASLSFAVNYLVDGLNPWTWKFTNLVIHLFNGLLVFLLARALLQCDITRASSGANSATHFRAAELLAVLIATGWLLLPINLTAVLYVVQREESLANLFVLAGLIGYVAGRQGMVATTIDSSQRWFGFSLCASSLIICTAIGLLAKETAAMLPLYALLIEWIMFRFDRSVDTATRKDLSIIVLFTLTLLLPMVIGMAWLLPNIFSPEGWASHNFTLDMRLMSEARIICDYIVWTLLPTPNALSFYHDQFQASTGLLSPWTTLAAIFALAALVVLVFRLRRGHPLVALGISLYLGCHLLTGTILPLELVYEHRNYFASFGVLLAVVPLLAAVPTNANVEQQHHLLLVLPRRALLGGFLLWWVGLTAITANAWGDPLRLAQELAMRAPDSPRAEYELGRTYIIYSHYDPMSPYTQLAYAPLEKAASLPESSILPQQALIFMNSRMGRPLKEQWWDSMIAKLKARKPGVQDESSLAALTECARDSACPLPHDQMVKAFEAALYHPNPSARLQATYSDYAWNVLGDHRLGLRMIMGAVDVSPREPAYRITLVRMLLALELYPEARQQIQSMRTLNLGGRLDQDIANLQAQLPPKPSE
jgi:protein O-mannosyl-transferase